MNPADYEYVKYRFSRAEMTLEEAKILAEKKHITRTEEFLSAIKVITE
jgi:hypothetical protein